MERDSCHSPYLIRGKTKLNQIVSEVLLFVRNALRIAATAWGAASMGTLATRGRQQANRQVDSLFV
jgi:hypothetical protein